MDPESSPLQTSTAKNNYAKKSVRRILVKGVFWRILLIEMILLVWSLGYRAATEDAAFIDLFWFAIRILILVTIIIAFVTLSLRSFLQKKIITPLETVSSANLKLDTEAPAVNHVDLPAGTPEEIEDIVETRQRMLEKILKVSSERLRLVNFIRDTFGRYVSKKVVDEILELPEGGKIGGRRKTVTILMSDLRGFMNLSETRDPEELVRLLNRYLERMSKVILDHDGMIDEFIGDAILGPVVFNFMIIQDHILRHTAQQASNVRRPEGIMIAVLIFFKGIGQTDGDHTVKHVGIDLVAHHENKSGIAGQPVFCHFLVHRPKNPVRMLFFPEKPRVVAGTD